MASIGVTDTAAAAIAFFAHIGGFVFGALVGLVLNAVGRQPRAGRPGRRGIIAAWTTG